MPDGSPLSRTDPKGLMIFTADGRFSWQLFRSDRPKFASKNRMQGTPEENAADLRGSLAYFGTYSVDEPEKTITTIVEGSTFPNSEGEALKRSSPE
jgi:Lipocalin-like domain